MSDTSTTPSTTNNTVTESTESTNFYTTTTHIGRTKKDPFPGRSKRSKPNFASKPKSTTKHTWTPRVVEDFRKSVFRSTTLAARKQQLDPIECEYQIQKIRNYRNAPPFTRSSAKSLGLSPIDPDILFFENRKRELTGKKSLFHSDTEDEDEEEA
jgi:hypothetical protein